jgi:hypothetical protein
MGTSMIEAVSKPDDQSEQRRMRRRREDLRDLILSTASSLLLTEGLSSGAEHITFKRVFDEIEQGEGIRITNASVIGRIWRDQADFQRDVLVAAALEAPHLDVVATNAVVEDALRSFDLTTPERRAAALTELIRLGCITNFALLTGSESWRMWVALWSLHIAGSSAKPDEEIGEILIASYHDINEAYITIFGSIFERLGFQVRAPLTIKDFVIEMASVAEGLAIREALLGGPLRVIELPTAPGGDLQEWNLFGLAVDALAKSFLEPVSSA